MVAQGTFRGRRAVTIENDILRLTVLQEGGHIAEICDRETGVSPLWIPPWPSIEPSSYDPVRHREYGTGAEAPLLAGIMGHNVCLDIFGGPSEAEEAAGLTVHGEGPIVPYEIASHDDELVARAELPFARLRFERRIGLRDRNVRIRETVENPTSHDRPIAWTQHVTLGPPFLEPGVTEFRASASRSQVHATPFGDDNYLQPGAVFDWPLAPRLDGGVEDFRRSRGAEKSSAYTAHLMDPEVPHAFFAAFSPRLRLAFGYVWNRRDYPWMGIWEECRSRRQPPWNGATITRGMEFGVSPFAETRRQMIERGPMFDTRTFAWVPARSRIAAEYWAIAVPADRIPETLAWPGE